MGKAGLAAASRGRMADLDMDAFRILRANIEFLAAAQDLKVLLVTSCLPEEGKSTVAASLAYASAIAGHRTLLVECDFRRPSLAPRLGLCPRPGLVEFLCDEAHPHEIVHTISTAQPSANGDIPPVDTNLLSCILAGQATANPTEFLGGRRFHDALQEMRSVYDVIVLDSAPLLPVADTLELLPLVDAVLFCVRDRRTTVDQAMATQRILTNLPDRPVGLVITGLAKGRGLEYGYYGQAYTRAPH